MKTSIYKISSPDGKFYIGQTIDLKRRLMQHKNLKKDDQLHLDIQELGWEVFKIEEICKCPVAIADEIETAFIGYYREQDPENCYNKVTTPYNYEERKSNLPEEPKDRIVAIFMRKDND